VRRGRIGKKHSAEARAKMSVAQRARGVCQRGTGKPYTPEENALLGTVLDREAAAKTGRELKTVAARRKRLNQPRHVAKLAHNRAKWD
jgi:hypothetical protein